LEKGRGKGVLGRKSSSRGKGLKARNKTRGEKGGWIVKLRLGCGGGGGEEKTFLRGKKLKKKSDHARGSVAGNLFIKERRRESVQGTFPSGSNRLGGNRLNLRDWRLGKATKGKTDYSGGKRGGVSTTDRRKAKGAQ